MHLTRPFRNRCLAIVPALLCLTFNPVLQAQTIRTTMLDYSTGSEFEDYLRILQIAGLTERYPWSVRAFSPREISRMAAADTAGPWLLAGGMNLGLASAGPITVGTVFNSAYPYGANDGAVWAGRGLTHSVRGGAAMRIGPISLVLAPVAFRADNRAFPLLDNGETGPQRFGHGRTPWAVDFPQRFGDQPYSRVDPGASTARFDSRLLTFGISTANEWIGPATEYPFLLGNNAPGFPHVFVGTGGPLNVWFARVHARVAWGRLEQSDYSPVTGPERYTSPLLSGTTRLATYATLVVMPRWMSGLEVGVGRFLHVPYRDGEPGSDFWTKPFKVFFLKNEYAAGDTLGADNQLASVFFRWVFPGSGFEVYGERGHEDHFYDSRDFVNRPDHERAYMLGFQKIVRRRASSLHVLKGELISYQVPASIYLHSQLRQGHTHQGQLLGSPAGVQNAAASTVAWTRYARGNRTTVAVRRIVRAERGNYPNTGFEDIRGSDVLLAAGLERMRLGTRLDFGAKVEAMQNLNRNFSEDVLNLNLQLTTRVRLW